MGISFDDIRKVGGTIAGVGAGIALSGPLGVNAALAGLGGGAAGQSDAAQKALKEMEKALGTAADVGEKIATGIGEVIIKVGETAIEIVKSLIPGAIGIRPMRQSEIDVAERVFKGTIQLHRVRIISIYGAGGRPFCIPGSIIGTLGFALPVVGPLLAWTSIVSGLAGKYLIFFGAEGFKDSINYKLKSDKDKRPITIPGQKLVHELVHVWQGHRRLFAWEYVGNSLWNQCTCGLTGADAYDYKATGKQWSAYTPEEQGRLVEHWFRATRGATDETIMDPRQPYIDTNIRAGSLSAQTLNVSVVTSGLTKVPDGTIGVPNALDSVGGLTKMLDKRPVGPTMTQLLDVLDNLKAQRMGLIPYQHQMVIRTQIQVLDAQIATYEGMVRAMVAQGALIEDRARFAVSMGQGQRVSSTAPAKLSPVLRR